MSLRMIAEQADASCAEVWNAEYKGAGMRKKAADVLADLLGVSVRHLTGELPAPPPPPDYPSWLTVPDSIGEEVSM